MTTSSQGSRQRGSGQDRVFPALLKYWRGHRGHSQLDLALVADVSSRHISFLETGRSRPSEQMVRWLAEALDVPLRDRNELLRAAGFPPQYPELVPDDALSGPVGQAVELMMHQQEPFPMIVLDHLYHVIRANLAAARLLQTIGVEPSEDANILRILFSPRVRGMIKDWETVGGQVLRRVQRESLHRPQDTALADLLAELLGSADVPTDWHTPALVEPNQPVLPIAFRLGDLDLSFVTAVTSFSAPQNLTLDELQIESWFPADDATRRACVELANTAREPGT